MTIKNPKTDGNEDLIPVDEDVPDDQTAERHVEIGDFKCKIVSSDPHGFWKVKYSKGRVPKQIEGEYTSATEAENAIKAYVAAKNHPKIVPTLDVPE